MADADSPSSSPPHHEQDTVREVTLTEHTPPPHLSMSRQTSSSDRQAVLLELDKLSDYIEALSPTHNDVPTGFSDPLLLLEQPPVDVVSPSTPSTGPASGDSEIAETSTVAVDEHDAFADDLSAFDAAQDPVEFGEKADDADKDDDDDEFGDFGDFAAGDATGPDGTATATADDEDDFGDFGGFDQAAPAPMTVHVAASTPTSTPQYQTLPWIDLSECSEEAIQQPLSEFLGIDAFAEPMDEQTFCTLDATFDDLAETFDLPSLASLTAAWDESEVFQWKRSDTRAQLLATLGLGGEMSRRPEGTGTGSSHVRTRTPSLTARSGSPASLSSIPSLPTSAINKPSTRQLYSTPEMVSIKASPPSAPLDETRAVTLANMAPDTLRSLSMPTLTELQAELLQLERSATAELQRLLDAREQALIDGELLNKSIEQLVNQAQKRKENELARQRKAAAAGGFKQRFNMMARIRRTRTPESSRSTSAVRALAVSGSDMERQRSSNSGYARTGGGGGGGVGGSSSSIHDQHPGESGSGGGNGGRQGRRQSM